MSTDGTVYKKKERNKKYKKSTRNKHQERLIKTHVKCKKITKTNINNENEHN